MMAAEIHFNDRQLRAIKREIDMFRHSYVKVGVLGRSAARAKRAFNLKGKQWVQAKFQSGIKVKNPKGGTVSVAAGYLTNSEIGAIHEFGSPDGRIPERSFLRMPILTRLEDELRKIPPDAWVHAIKVGGIKALLQAIGQAALNVVHDAFHSGGFGRWAKLSAATIRRKKNSDILVETAQLQRSISFAIIERRGP